MLKLRCLLSFACAVVVSFYAQATDWTEGFITGTPEIKSISQLTFGPDGILFIGDAKNAKVIAVSLEDKEKISSKDKLEVADIEAKIADLLGAKSSDILIHDLVVNPLSQNVYLAVSRGRSKSKSFWELPNDLDDASILLRVKRDGKIEEVNLSNIKYAEISIPNPISADKKYWRGNPRVDAISDLAYADGKLFVAGLSNEEFASSMRVIPFPFKSQVNTSTVEIYHGAHGKYETEAPINTFLPYNLNGVPQILAVFTCTPLVTIPVNELQDKKHIKGRTVAELGGGNMPLDMISYQKDGKNYILIANSTRNLMRIEVDKIANYQGTITTHISQRFEKAGVEYLTIPLMAQQMDRLNDDFVLILQRLPQGSLNLTSVTLKWL
jgi:hypothetical protein